MLCALHFAVIVSAMATTKEDEEKKETNELLSSILSDGIYNLNIKETESTDETKREAPKLEELFAHRSIDETHERVAWLSAETTIHEINVNERYFSLSGNLSVFWKDPEFDKFNKLKNLTPNKKYVYPPPKGEILYFSLLFHILI